MQDLVKENESFARQLERYDALYRDMLNDYLKAIEENKKFVESKVPASKQTILGTTSGNMGSLHFHAAKLCSAMPG